MGGALYDSYNPMCHTTSSPAPAVAVRCSRERSQSLHESKDSRGLVKLSAQVPREGGHRLVRFASGKGGYLMRRLIMFAAMLGLLVTASAAQAQWGTLKGRFVYDGDPPKPKQIDTPNVQPKEPVVDESLLVDPKTKGVANVVVYVRTKGVKVHPDYKKAAGEKVIFNNKDFRFVPHVLTMQQSQTLELGNSDPVSHNSNFQPIGDEGINPLIPAGKSADYKANRAQTIPQPVSCNIHPWMKGYILTRPDPYATVSKPDGSFEIKNLPAGELEFQFWHEKTGYLVAKPDWTRGRVKLNIKSGGVTDLGDIKLSPSLFNK